MKIYLYRASNLKSTITFMASVSYAEVNFWRPLKTVVSCDLVIIGRAKRAPHWGVQSRFRVIYIYTRKMVPTTGRASTFLKIFENSNLNPN